MAAPSMQHESRVTLLGDIADLAGFVVPSRIDAHLLPDLVRFHHRQPSLFVADAKATESPGNHETKMRILVYFRALRPWLQSGFMVQIAVCTGIDSRHRWLDTLDSMAKFSGMRPTQGKTFVIDDETQVSSVTPQLVGAALSAPAASPANARCNR
jgi:hypothetical protein